MQGQHEHRRSHARPRKSNFATKPRYSQEDPLPEYLSICPQSAPTRDNTECSPNGPLSVPLTILSSSFHGLIQPTQSTALTSSTCAKIPTTSTISPRPNTTLRSCRP